MGEEVTGRTAELLAEQEWVSRESDVREDVMEVRAINADGGIRGKLTDVYVADGFAPYMYTRFSCRQQDGTYPPLHDSKAPTRKQAHERADARAVGEYAIRYDPRVTAVFSLENGDAVHVQWSMMSMSWTPSSHLIHALYEALGFDFERLAEEDIPVVYEPSSDTGGTFTLETAKRGSVTASRRAYDGEPELTKEGRNYTFEYASAHETLYGGWLDYLRDAEAAPSKWVAARVVRPFGDDDEYTLVVSTPTGKTGFPISRSKDEDSVFWNVVETLGGGDPSQVDGEQVWVRPHTASLHDDNTVRGMRNVSQYTVVSDVEHEWELAVENPNKRTDRAKRGLLQRIQSVF